MPYNARLPHAGTEPIHCHSIQRTLSRKPVPNLNKPLALLLGVLASGASLAADPFMVMERALPSPASDMRPAGACETTELSGTLTLARAVERALCAHPATRNTWLAVRLRAAELGRAQSAYLPGVSLAGRLARGGDDLLPSGRTDWLLGLDAQYLLYDFGGREARREAAEALLAAARASHDAAVRTLYLQTVSAYFSLLTAQGAVAAAREAEVAALEALKAASARVAAGSAIPADRLQAKTAYAQRQIERIRSEGELARLRGELAALMGDVRQTAWTVAENEAAFSQAFDLRAVDTLIDAARTRRPEFRVAEATLLAREAEVRSARAAGKPSVSAYYEGTRQDSGGGPATRSSVGLNLTVPLFTGYRSTYEIAAAQAQAELARTERDRVANDVALEVWRAYYRLQSEAEADRRSADLVESATAAAALALGRYRAGMGLMLDVLTAQASLAQARQTQLQTRLGVRVARAELAQAIGELSWDWMETAQQEGVR